MLRKEELRRLGEIHASSSLRDCLDFLDKRIEQDQRSYDPVSRRDRHSLLA
jgi:hypothetical protein